MQRLSKAACPDPIFAASEIVFLSQQVAFQLKEEILLLHSMYIACELLPLVRFVAEAFPAYVVHVILCGRKVQGSWGWEQACHRLQTLHVCVQEA